MGTGASFSEVKRQERESDYLPPYIADVKNKWCYTSTSTSTDTYTSTRYSDCTTGWTVRYSTPGRCKEFFSSWKRPPSLLFSGHRGSSPGVKRPGQGVNHWPPSSANVKKERSCTSVGFVAMDRENRTFAFMRLLLHMALWHARRQL